MNTADMFNDDVFNNIESSLFVSKVTIVVVKRNGKKSITNVIGMAEDLDLKKNFILFKENI